MPPARSSRVRVAVAGAGIYGSTIAIRLSQLGHSVDLYDPLGIMQAASAINQYRVHAGYHYPRSQETIDEILEARDEFVATFEPSIVRSTRNFYAIPREGSWTSPDDYEAVMDRHRLPLRSCRPSWIDFDHIDRCYEVDEDIYDPVLLRKTVEERLALAGISFRQEPYAQTRRDDYEFIVFATYGLGPSKRHFDIAKFQVAEKVLIDVPTELQGMGLVVVDGPFTAFDPYGLSGNALFGSSKHTNHWVSTDPDEPIPARYEGLLNHPEFRTAPFTKFEEMRVDGGLYVPLLREARYLGSRFTIRVVEDSQIDDRRVLYVQDDPRDPHEIHVFSGKVLGAVKAARIVCERIAART